MCPIIKLLTFDVTNTLLKFRKSPPKYYTEVGRSYGYELDEDQVAKQFRATFKNTWSRNPNFGSGTKMTWEDWWRQVVVNTFSEFVKDKEKIETIASKLITDFKQDKVWEVCDGTKEILDHLSTKNIKIGVISNFDPRLHEILKNMHINKYFDFVVTSYESGFPKPDVEIFKSALSKCKDVVGMNAIHIGDNVNLDYHGARNAGWNALIVNKKLTQADLNNVETAHVYKSLLDLKHDLINDNIKYKIN